MNTKRFRGLTGYLLKDLAEKMVFIGGPRQVGKTTLSRDIIGKEHFNSYGYYNWDSKPDRAAILKEKWGEAGLLIFDEIHKYKRWKTHIKGIYDKFKDERKIILTGSSRLDVFRRGGDSLQGRYHYYRLHPFSCSEINEHIPVIQPFKALSFSRKSDEKMVNDLMKFGGFPEPFLKKSAQALRRWHKEKKDRLVREDIRDLSAISDIGSLQLLVDLLPERVGSPLSLNAIREDLEVSFKAVKSWMDVLESLYYCYRIYPFQHNKVRALKKEPKLYLWDWSEVPDADARFENLIAGHLLKTVHFLNDYEGYNAQLHYLRDKEKREVDFLVTVDRKPWFSVEVKRSDTEIPTPMRYFKEKLNIPFSYLVTLNSKEEYTEDGIKVLPAAKFLTGLL